MGYVGFIMGSVIGIGPDPHGVSALRRVRMARVTHGRALFFRAEAKRLGLGPTVWSSDEHIFDLFHRVMCRFRRGCSEAGRAMPSRPKLNFIILKILEFSEAAGMENASALIDFEVQEYLDYES